MYTSNLLEIFKSFSQKEMKEFEEFVSSPYYNKNKNVIQLFNILKVEYPKFDKNSLHKEELYKKIYKGSKYNDATMRTLMFYLQEVAEKFLAVKNFENNHFASRSHLLLELNERDLDKLFAKDYKLISKEFDKIKKRGVDFYYYKFVVDFENAYNQNKIHYDRDEKYLNKFNLNEIFGNLTAFYILRIYRHYLYSLNMSMKFNTKHPVKLFDELVSSHNPNDYADAPLINMYYYCVLMVLRPEEEENYFNAKKILSEHEQDFDEVDVNEFYINLENYCKRKNRAGKREFLHELYEILKAELVNKAYMFRGLMPDLFYKGMFDTAMRLKEYEFAKKFIIDYKNELPEQFRENTFLQCMAIYEFVTNNFEKALELISKVKFDEIYQKMDVKCLINAIYYELDFTPSLEASIDTFRHFIKNDKLAAPFRKESYANFNKNLLKLHKLRKKPNLQKLEELYDETEQNITYNKEWLLEKIKKLIEKEQSTHHG
jgi:cytochrome c-type biogenesis protein CcmE